MSLFKIEESPKEMHKSEEGNFNDLSQSEHT